MLPLFLIRIIQLNDFSIAMRVPFAVEVVLLRPPEILQARGVGGAILRMKRDLHWQSNRIRVTDVSFASAAAVPLVHSVVR